MIIFAIWLSIESAVGLLPIVLLVLRFLVVPIEVLAQKRDIPVPDVPWAHSSLAALLVPGVYWAWGHLGCWPPAPWEHGSGGLTGYGSALIVLGPTLTILSMIFGEVGSFRGFFLALGIALFGVQIRDGCG